MDFTLVLNDVIKYINKLGFKVVIKNDLDTFFKGDLDGKTIYLVNLKDEEKLFNVLHLVGHCIQWNLSKELRDFGNVVYTNPSDELINKLQTYEYEANCYGLMVLKIVGHYYLKQWLENKFEEDLLYLTYFYKTGEKNKNIKKLEDKYSFNKSLECKEIPKIKVKSQKLTRNGIVINF